MELIDIAGFPVIKCDQEMTWDEAMLSPVKANTEKVGGFTDWVLPDTQTLRALALLKPEKSWYWSSSPYPESPLHAWCVGFSDARLAGNDKGNLDRVYLVRAGQCLKIGRAGQIESMRQVGIKLVD